MDAKIKEYINKIKAGAVSAGKVAGKTANDVAKQAKLNIKIFDTNTEIDVIYKDIGKLVYDVHLGEEVSNEAIEAMLTSIDSKKELINELKAELAELKNVLVCPVCGKEVAKSCSFCSECGAKIEKEECKCEAEADSCCEEEASECCCEEKADECCCEEKMEECCCEEAEASENCCCCECEAEEKKDE